MTSESLRDQDENPIRYQALMGLRRKDDVPVQPDA